MCICDRNGGGVARVLRRDRRRLSTSGHGNSGNPAPGMVGAKVWAKKHGLVSELERCYACMGAGRKSPMPRTGIANRGVPLDTQ